MINEFLKTSFENYKPRSTFLSSRDLNPVFKSDEAFNICGFKNVDYPVFEEVWKNYPAASQMQKLFDALYNRTEKLKENYSFVTFSTNILGHARCPSHLHNYINGKPCITTTYCIPLNSPQLPQVFNISKECKKWPTRYYLQPDAIPDGIEFEKLHLAPDKITKIVFNSSHLVHSIEYTNDIFAFLVIDGTLQSEPFNIRLEEMNYEQIS